MFVTALQYCKCKVNYNNADNDTKLLIIIIIMVIFKCYFSGEIFYNEKLKQKYNFYISLIYSAQPNKEVNMASRIKQNVLTLTKSVIVKCYFS